MEQDARTMPKKPASTEAPLEDFEAIELTPERAAQTALWYAQQLAHERQRILAEEQGQVAYAKAA